MIICFILIKNNLFCVDNVRRIYILINWLGLKGLKSDSLIWVLDVFAIAFRIYPEGPLILSVITMNYMTRPELGYEVASCLDKFCMITNTNYLMKEL